MGTSDTRAFVQPKMLAVGIIDKCDDSTGSEPTDKFSLGFHDIPVPFFTRLKGKVCLQVIMVHAGNRDLIGKMAGERDLIAVLVMWMVYMLKTEKSVILP